VLTEELARQCLRVSQDRALSAGLVERAYERILHSYTRSALAPVLFDME
jgi:hypothetical protein